MNNRPEQDKIDKLPKWAREYINDLENERDAALRSLHKFRDEDTPSNIYTENMVCTNEQENSKAPTVYRRYVQDDKIYIDYNGIRADIFLNRGEIDIQYSLGNRFTADVILQPVSYQKIVLKRVIDARDKDSYV